MLKGIFLVLVSVVLIIFFYIGVLQGYSWKEMDWNCNGTTTLTEILQSTDIGKRNISINKNSCIEYFSYKDGLTIKVICPEMQKCMNANVSSHPKVSRGTALPSPTARR
jgi:hypothetical protein